MVAMPLPLPCGKGRSEVGDASWQGRARHADPGRRITGCTAAAHAHQQGDDASRLDGAHLEEVARSSALDCQSWMICSGWGIEDIGGAHRVNVSDCWGCYSRMLPVSLGKLGLQHRASPTRVHLALMCIRGAVVGLEAGGRQALGVDSYNCSAGTLASRQPTPIPPTISHVFSTEHADAQASRLLWLLMAVVVPRSTVPGTAMYWCIASVSFSARSTPPPWRVRSTDHKVRLLSTALLGGGAGGCSASERRGPAAEWSKMVQFLRKSENLPRWVTAAAGAAALQRCRPCARNRPLPLP